ncbi:MAG: DMT family transporter [Burkholderiaceae bacterium]|nr:DMT family transporter [Burkholderiaceae bacterium]MCD8515801.1 DMT family transporter [Burkholderiaceae bacterium]MCD8565389.1 DMT family transporter [Burkholderiaceae bacterium]
MDSRNRGYLLALIGVFIFALTMPVTKFVVGTDNPSSVSPVFATFLRALIAGVCSIGYLLVTYKLRFPRALLRPLLISAAGTVVGFPLLLSMGLVGATSIQGAVVTGFLPMATAVMMSLYLGKQQNVPFWVCAIIGFGLIATFSYLQGDGSFRPSDVYLMLAVLSAAAGYVAGAKVSEQIPPSQAICWVLIVSLPLTLPMTFLFWPDHTISGVTWAGLGYLGIFSMWLGFFAWYKGMNLAGPIAASQVQLLQPFIALFLSSLLLGEQLDVVTIGFAVALIATLVVSKRLSLRA